jgi:hypothetical protein
MTPPSKSALLLGGGWEGGKTHGIIFKPEMILAYLEGRKNQTRRTRGLDPVNKNPDNWNFVTISLYQDKFKALFRGKATTYTVSLPYGHVAETLYFKETWKMWERAETDCRDFLHYRADDAKVDPTWWDEYEWTRPDPVWAGKFGKWQSSMFMPYICSRFRSIPIVNVRVQRLFDITEHEAQFEGVTVPPPQGIIHSASYREEYFKLWDSINGKTLPASKNPWVWVYEFPVNQNHKRST